MQDLTTHSMCCRQKLGDMMSDFRKSEKYQKTLAGLPEELKDPYEDLVAQYSWHTTNLFGRGYVAYEVLASLIRDGWRCSGEPLQSE